MATLDDSPSVYSGQSWSTWAEKVPLEEEDDPEEDDPSNRFKDDTNSMKLRKEDLPLFGYCPAQDELYLVVCEKCGQVVKPQALKAHLEKRHGSKDSSHHVSSKLQSRGSNHGGVTSHRSSPQLHSSKSGIKQSCAPSVKVDRTISDTVKLPSVEVTLKRLSDDVKTVSLHPELVKSQISPKRCSNLTANSVSNGTVKSTANGAMTTSTDSSPSCTAPSSGSGMFCASHINNTSPQHNISHKPSTPSPFSSYSSNKHASGFLSNSPPSNCAPPLERTSEREKNSDSSSTSDKGPQSGCLSKNSSTSLPSLSKNSSVSKNPSVKMKNSPIFQKVSSSSSSSSNKSSSSSKTSSSPSKCSTSPVKNSNSPARSAPSPAKSALSPAKSAPSPSPVKSAPSPAKSPSKSASSPSHCSTSSTPKRSSKAPKEKKFILCRDREFDPNVHCGVIRPDDGRHCTRSLTCKTHALSLRRAVPGRRKDFDELLKEHRAKKEALLKAAESEKIALAGGHTVTATSPNSTTPEGSTKLALLADHSALMKESPSPISSLSLKHIHPLSNATKAHKLSSKSINSHHQRSSSSGLHSPPWFKEEMSPPTEVFSRLSSDGEIDTEDFQDKGDNPYISQHPRPISTCTFGGRCASGGWYLFSRKTDYLRSAFLSTLEKHLHPPPHKKLCVESKLPKEPQFLTNSMDPYEFNIVDMTAGSNVFNQSPLLNSVNKPQPLKQKSKPASSRSHKAKGDNCSSPRASLSGFPNSPSPTGNHGAPLKRKRSSSGAGNSTISPNIAALPNVSLQNAMLGNISLTSPIATCIPSVNVNLSSNTLSHFNASLASTKGGQLHKNNLIKDASGGLNLLLTTSMDQPILNGQYMNISGNVLEMAASQAGLHLEEKQTSSSKRSRSGGGTSKQNSNRQISTTNPESLCSIPNNFMASITQKAFLVDKSMLAPAVTSFPASSVVSLANSAMSPPQASPAATPSPLTFYRSGSISPQVSAASPTPNGVISPVNMKAYSLSGLNHIINQKTASPPASRNSTPSPNISNESPTTHFTFIGQSPSSSGSYKSYNSKSNSSHRSAIHPPTVLPTAMTFSTGAQTNHGNSLHNFCVTNANIGSLPLKGTSMNLGKNIPIPVPFTLPLTMASNLTNQQQPTATLFVTSDNVSKAELQLQQTSTTHSNVIS